MNYQLQADQTLPQNVQRIARQQIDKALAYLQQPGNDVDEAVHESRKHFKKLRALLRLVRKEIGEEVYQRENKCFRDAGRLLSDLRDSAVVIKTLDDLLEDVDEVVDEEAFVTMRETLVIFYHGTRQRVLEEEQALTQAAEKIRAARQRVADWPVEEDSFTAVSGGLHKIYRRGLHRREDAANAPSSAPVFHEWRKRVKYLWYSVRLLQPVWPEPMEVLADEIHDISDYLGDAHDLVQLKNVTENSIPALENEDANFALLSFIERKQADLHSKALQQGQLVYAEPPDDFVQRMGAYWETAVS